MSSIQKCLLARMKFLLPALLILASAAPSFAQGPGIRGGVSIDPDQFYFGGHYETSPLIDRLHFRPNVEIGIGDDVVTTGLNMEFVYKFPTRSDWGMYVGGGPAVNFYSYDDSRGGDTESEGGLNVLVGVESSRGLMFEIKIGAIDSPDLKFGVGWSFR